MELNLKEVSEILSRFYSDTGEERCGFIYRAGFCIDEVKNISGSPQDSFRISTYEIRKYTEDLKAQATWHTHPSASSNLSGEDHKAFKSYPELIHFIIGNDGVKAYQYCKEKKVILELSVSP